MKQTLLILWLSSCLASATTYYCATNGSNSADGSIGTPWLTISNGMKHLSLSGGDTLLVKPGNYAENPDLSPAYSFAAMTYVSSQSSNAADVVVSGTSGSYNLHPKCTNICFCYMTFQQHSTADDSAIHFDYGWNNYFYHCNIICVDAATGKGAYAFPSSATISNLVFDSCSFYQTGLVSTCRGATFYANGGQVLNCLITNCTFSLIGNSVVIHKAIGISVVNSILTSTGSNIVVNGDTITQSTNITFNGDTILTASGDAVTFGQGVNLSFLNSSITTSNGHAVILGLDATYASATAGLMSGAMVSNCIINSPNNTGVNHGLLFGANCINCTAAYNTISSGNWCLVIKENLNCTGIFNTLYGGIASCVAIKAATNATAAHNICFVNGTNTASGIRAYKGDTGNYFYGATVTNNWIISPTKNTTCLYWGSTTNEDGGNGICDFNTYFFSSQPNFGKVQATTNVTTIEGLRAAWSGYAVSGNDTHSWYGPTINAGFCP